MTVEVVSTEGLPAGGPAETIKSAIEELQRLKIKVVSGAAAAANIAVAGIATEDTLVAVIQLDVAVDTGTSATGNKVQDAADLLAEASIFNAGNIRCSTTNTTGDKLLVAYFDKH